MLSVIFQLIQTNMDPDILERYMSEHKMHRFEGTTGVRHFEKLVEDMGYTDGQFIGRHGILNFLADNSGAIQALIEWIEQANVPEWEENLSDCLQEKAEEEEFINENK